MTGFQAYKMRQPELSRVSANSPQTGPAGLDYAFAAALLAHRDMGRNAIFYRLDMADNADLATSRLQAFQCVEGQIEAARVQGAGALVDEQGGGQLSLAAHP